MKQEWPQSTSSETVLRFREVHGGNKRWSGMWTQACLIPKSPCFVTTKLCCFTLSVWQDHLLTAPRMHHCQESYCLQISTGYLLCLQPTSYGLHKAFQAASPRSLARMGLSLPSLNPHRALSVYLSWYLPVPTWTIVTHMLLQERRWSQWAWCHQWLTLNRHWLSQSMCLLGD